MRSDAGKAYLILGASLGATTDISLADADYHLTGEESGDNAGYSVSSAGDVDGDGTSDILVGAPYSDDLDNSAGKAYLILGASLGSTPSMSLADADVGLLGGFRSDRAGESVSGAGDMDGDGWSDILIGAAYADLEGQYSGQVSIILGGD